MLFLYYQKKIIFCRLIEKFLHKKVNKILVNSLSIKKQLIKDESLNIFEIGKIEVNKSSRCTIS